MEKLEEDDAMKQIKFSIPGQPFGKQRPRVVSRVLFCKLDDAPLVRINDGVSAWIERSYANYLRLFEQFN